MKTRRLRWGASSLQALVQGTATATRQESSRVAGLAKRAAQIGFPTNDFDHSAELTNALAESLAVAEMFWVTEDMAAIALDAATDVPQIRAEDAPASDGFIAFGCPMPNTSTETIGGLSLRDGRRTDIPHRDPVPVDALQWQLRGSELRVWLMCRDERLPLPLYEAPTCGLTAFLHQRTTLPGRFDDSFTALGPEGVSVDADKMGPLALLSACWVLMATPTVADTQQIDGRWGGKTTTKTRPQDVVTIVDLRPLRHEKALSEGGRKLTVRHLVRGHWTHQPYGPNRALRRLQWIAPYTRGPEGAPLIETRRVWVWRR